MEPPEGENESKEGQQSEDHVEGINKEDNV